MKYDILVVGGATSGTFIAKRMAEKGYKVKVIDSSPVEKIGAKYDIVHLSRKDFDKFDLPRVGKGDPEYALEYRDGYTASPYGNHKKHVIENMFVLHLHEYVLLMNNWAISHGAEYEYNALFKEFVFDDGKIVGVRYSTPEGEKEVLARVVIDCTGANAPVRRSLPPDYGVETFALGDNDKFYVALRYVKWKDEKDYITSSCGCPYYKTFIDPDEDPTGGIIGIGSCNSFEYGDPILDEFLESANIPPHTVTRIERGTTPYTRTPHSFVADGYIVSGDAACLTKPMNGEGITSSMVQLEIVEKVLDRELKKDGYLTKERLWDVNVQYNATQGAEFASTRPMLIKLVKARKSEFEYFFKYLPESLLQDPEKVPGFKVPIRDFVTAGWGILKGIITRKICKETRKLFFDGLKLSGKLNKLYKAYPTTPEGYDQWAKEADALWQKVGKMT